eukprot:NODE_23_length_42016_cov_0.755803.p2 type:complete len:997 gc:universal NODE_23_length_42016_cov_0.755803:16799-19789(+)
MSFSEHDEVIQGRLRLQRGLQLEEPVELNIGLNEKNWMDMNRKQIKAYEYLCHIGEAKQWIEACSDQELGAVVDLDEQMRNGVVLAKLAKKFKPDIVKRIFGEDVKLQFRHSDNINYFFAFCKAIELPDVFVFELTDLYDKKNIPKVIYNIHALAHLLSSKGLAPRIKDLRGKLEFTNEELENTQKQIEEMNLPDFNNAGAALAKEMKMNPFETIEQHFNDNSDDLALIQRIFLGALVRSRFRKQKAFYNSQIDLILAIQSHYRGLVVRNNFKKIRAHLANNKVNIIFLQATIRGHIERQRFLLVRKKIKEFLSTYVKFQARVKGFLSRRNFIGQSSFYKAKERDIVKIQSKYKAHYVQGLFKKLHSKNPNFQSIQKFGQFLGNHEIDYQEEMDMTEKRQDVIKNIRDIAQLEQLITELDLKVALIVKNRISLEDITKLSGKVKNSGSNGESANDKSSFTIFKSSDKESRKKQELYQNLMYLLQTNPLYLSKLVLEMRQMTSETVKKFIEQAVLTIYGYAQNPREEYLLLRLFNLTIHQEINDVNELSDFIRSNPQFVRLVVNYIRGAKDRQFLQTVLKSPIEEVFNIDNDLDSDPISIYKKIVTREETETGQKSAKKLDITREEALQDPQTRSEYDGMMRNIQSLADLFLDKIISSIHRMPYGIRYIAKEVKNALQTKFPNEDKINIQRIIGNLIFFRYINPAVVAPEAFDVIPSDKTLSMSQRKNLSEISKVLNQVSVGKINDKDTEVATSYISRCSARFLKFLDDVTNVVELEEAFQIDHYSDFARTKKPILFISPTEIVGLHKLLIEYKPASEDFINHILNELGPVEDDLDSILAKKTKEISFTLNSNLIPQSDESEEIELKQLFTETKRLITIVMKVQRGKNLIDLLEKPVKDEEERAYQSTKSHHSLNNVRDKPIQSLISLSNVRKEIVDSVASKTQISDMSLTDMKKLIQLNLVLLEEKGKTSKKSGYSEIVASVAKVQIFNLGYCRKK